MGKENTQIIGLNQLELTNDDIFVRKTVDQFKPEAKVIVYETHNAILLKNGRLQETLEPGEYPLFETKHGLFKDHKVGALVVDLIYVSKTAEMQIKWGTPVQFSFRDPVTSSPIKMGACGEFGVKVENPRKLYCELIGAKPEFTVDDLKERLRGRVLNEIEPVIAKFMKDERLSYAEFVEHKQKVAKGILPILRRMFSENYGLNVTYFLISNVMIDENDQKALEAELKKIRDKGEQAEAKAEARDDYQWWVAEFERLEDKQFEREQLMRELERADYDKYLNVCKLIGWENAGDKSKHCPECGAPYEDGVKFCGQCGHKLSEEALVCSSCGTKNPSGNKFCSNCGHKL